MKNRTKKYSLEDSSRAKATFQSGHPPPTTKDWFKQKMESVPPAYSSGPSPPLSSADPARFFTTAQINELYARRHDHWPEWRLKAFPAEDLMNPCTWIRNEMLVLVQALERPNANPEDPYKIVITAMVRDDQAEMFEASFLSTDYPEMRRENDRGILRPAIHYGEILRSFAGESFRRARFLWPHAPRKDELLLVIGKIRDDIRLLPDTNDTESRLVMRVLQKTMTKKSPFVQDQELFQLFLAPLNNAATAARRQVLWNNVHEMKVQKHKLMLQSRQIVAQQVRNIVQVEKKKTAANPKRKRSHSPPARRASRSLSSDSKVIARALLQAFINAPTKKSKLKPRSDEENAPEPDGEEDDAEDV